MTGDWVPEAMEDMGEGYRLAASTAADGEFGGEGDVERVESGDDDVDCGCGPWESGELCTEERGLELAMAFVESETGLGTKIEGDKIRLSKREAERRLRFKPSREVVASSNVVFEGE